MAEADAEHRHLADAARARSSAAPATAAGSPGPFERNTPSGSRARTSAAGVDAGTTSTWQPAPTRWRRIVRLIPKSYATTRNGASSSPDGVGLGGGDRRRRGRCRRSSARPRPPRAPRPRRCRTRRAARRSSRRWRVRRRVSIPVMPGTPCSTQQVVEDRSARQLLGRRARSRTITPEQNGRAALVVVGVHAVVADVRVRERDHLPRVRRVGDDLLVARQRGVEHDLAGGDRRVGADRLALERRAVGRTSTASRFTVPPLAPGERHAP